MYALTFPTTFRGRGGNRERTDNGIVSADTEFGACPALDGKNPATALIPNASGKPDDMEAIPSQDDSVRTID